MENLWATGVSVTSNLYPFSCNILGVQGVASWPLYFESLSCLMKNSNPKCHFSQLATPWTPKILQGKGYKFDVTETPVAQRFSILFLGDFTAMYPWNNTSSGRVPPLGTRPRQKAIHQPSWPTLEQTFRARLKKKTGESLSHRSLDGIENICFLLQYFGVSGVSKSDKSHLGFEFFVRQLRDCIF